MKEDIFIEEGIERVLDYIIEEKPGFVIHIGGSSLITDLVSNIVPTISISTVFSKLPVTSGTFSVIGRKMREEELNMGGNYKRTNL